MNRIVHFEIHAENPERAMDFYGKIFGWTFQEWKGLGQDYWVVMTAKKESKEPGINGGLLRKNKSENQNMPPNAFVCTIQVENIDETMTAIEKSGGTVAMPKFAIGGMAWQAYCKDSEGNIFGVHQTDENAK